MTDESVPAPVLFVAVVASVGVDRVGSALPLQDEVTASEVVAVHAGGGEVGESVEPARPGDRPRAAGRAQVAMR
jgi:hypothetical protein